jgi:hypothetical protein
MFGLRITEWKGHGRVGTHTNKNSYHYKTFPDGTGRAFDAVGTADQMLRFARHIKKYYKYVTEGIHNPNLSIDHGRRVPPSFWGSTVWEQHRSHVHIAV